MRPDVEQILQETGSRYPALLPVLPDLRLACEMLIAAFSEGGQLLLCGNGGSAADSEHIAGELLKGYLLRRPVPLSDKARIRALLKGLGDERETDEMLERLQLGLPAVPLVSQPAITSAIANDLGADLVYAQQVLAMGRPGDVLLGISTSGRAQNILQAMRLARGLGLRTIAMTGESGGLLAGVADLCLRVPATATPQVQELHLPLYHTLCAMLEQHFFA